MYRYRYQSIHSISISTIYTKMNKKNGFFPFLHIQNCPPKIIIYIKFKDIAVQHVVTITSHRVVLTWPTSLILRHFTTRCVLSTHRVVLLRTLKMPFYSHTALCKTPTIQCTHDLHYFCSFSI